MKNKKFDCVKMKNEIQEKIYYEINPTSVKDYITKILQHSSNNPLWKEFTKNKNKNKNQAVILY